MRHLFVVDSLDKHIQNEKELIRPRRLLPAARATRARSAQFYVVLIRHDSTGVGGLFCICVESINLNLSCSVTPLHSILPGPVVLARRVSYCRGPSRQRGEFRT
jgi:hypothetical protein